jgi:hypothetical protein
MLVKRNVRSAVGDRRAGRGERTGLEHMRAVREAQRVDLHDEAGIRHVGARQRVRSAAEVLRIDRDLDIAGRARRQREADDADRVGDLLVLGQVAVDADLRRLRERAGDEAQRGEQYGKPARCRAADVWRVKCSAAEHRLDPPG